MADATAPGTWGGRGPITLTRTKFPLTVVTKGRVGLLGKGATFLGLLIGTRGTTGLVFGAAVTCGGGGRGAGMMDRGAGTLARVKMAAGLGGGAELVLLGLAFLGLATSEGFYKMSNPTPESVIEHCSLPFLSAINWFRSFFSSSLAST